MTLPSGWRFEKIARCFDLIGSGTTPKSHMLDYYDGEIPWLQSGDLHGHYIDHTEKCVNERACQECNLRIYKAPFIAISMYGSIGNLSIVKIDACTNQACCTLCQPRYLIDPNFAYFALEASREKLLLSAHGGTQPNVSREAIRRLKIPLPPLSEQRRIAAYLDAKCADVDKAIAAKQRQVEMIETLWKNVLHDATLHGVGSRVPRDRAGRDGVPSPSACAGRDGVPSPSENTTAGGGTPALPSGWRFEKIARCFDLIGSGTTPKSHMLDYYDGEIPWLQSGDLHGHYIDHTEKCVNERACQECNLRIYKAPFIAIAMYGASIANLSIVKIDACTNQACCTLCQPRYLIDPNFAYFALEASREELLLSAHGGTQPNISREAIRRLKIPLPPLSEQRQIAAYLDAKRAGFDALAGNLRRQVETLEQYRRSLIRECVTGKRRCA